MSALQLEEPTESQQQIENVILGLLAAQIAQNESTLTFEAVMRRTVAVMDECRREALQDSTIVQWYLLRLLSRFDDPAAVLDMIDAGAEELFGPEGGTRLVTPPSKRARKKPKSKKKPKGKRR